MLVFAGAAPPGASAPAMAKNQSPTKLLGPDIFRWGEGFPGERVGAK